VQVIRTTYVRISHLEKGGHGAVGVRDTHVKLYAGRNAVQGVEGAETNKYYCGQDVGENEGEVGDKDHGEELPKASPEQHVVGEVDDGEEAGEKNAGEGREPPEEAVEEGTQEAEGEVEQKAEATCRQVDGIGGGVLEMVEWVSG
jgi:hypothetical protein